MNQFVTRSEITPLKTFRNPLFIFLRLSQSFIYFFATIAIFFLRLSLIIIIIILFFKKKNGFCIEPAANEPAEMIGLIKEDDPSRHFKGYTDKAASEKKILRDVFEKGDTWFRSGDLLRCDEVMKMKMI